MHKCAVVMIYAYYNGTIVYYNNNGQSIISSINVIKYLKIQNNKNVVSESLVPSYF